MRGGLSAAAAPGAARQDSAPTAAPAEAATDLRIDPHPGAAADPGAGRRPPGAPADLAPQVIPHRLPPRPAFVAAPGLDARPPTATAPGLSTVPPAAAAAAPRGDPRLVLMLSAAHPPEDLRIVGKLGAALARAGRRVAHLAPGEGTARRAAAGVEIRPYAGPGGGWRARLAAIPALARRAAALAPAVIHAHEPDAWLAGWLAARRCGARLVLDVHEHYPSRLDPVLPAPLRPPARALLRAAGRALARRADAVVVAKDGLAADYAPAPCVAVRNHAADPGLPPRRHAPGPLRLVHLGALSAARGAFVMLDALARLPEATRLLLIGRFTDGSEAAFHARAAALGLSARIESLPWLPRDTALLHAARCDVGLVLFQPGVENHRLALPHKLFDCLLLGLPVVVPAFAEAVAEVVDEARCGFAVQTGDPAAVAAAIAALADVATREEMGLRGRAAALTRFGWAAEEARLLALYDRLLPG